MVGCDENRRHRVAMGGRAFVLLHFVWWLPAVVPPQWSLWHLRGCAGESGAAPGLPGLCGEWAGNFMSALLSSWFTGISMSQTANLVFFLPLKLKKVEEWRSSKYTEVLADSCLVETGPDFIVLQCFLTTCTGLLRSPLRDRESADVSSEGGPSYHCCTINRMQVKKTHRL